VRRPALFVALTLVCFVWTFPHKLVVERLVRTALARAGVASSIESVESRWPKIARMSVSPPGYLLRGIRLARNSDTMGIDALYLGFGLRGGVDIEGNACGGSWRGKLQRGRRFGLTFTGVEPERCLVLSHGRLEGRFGGALALRGIGRGQSSGPAGTAVREGKISIEGRNARFSGTGPGPTALAAFELSAVDLEASLDGPALVLDGSTAEAEGIQWRLPAATVFRRAGSLLIEGRLAVRVRDERPRGKMIAGLLPEAATDPEGWRHYKLSGAASRPQLSAVR